MRRRAPVAWLSLRGTELLGKKISSCCLASPMMGISVMPILASSCMAELSCPLPPSTITRSGTVIGALPCALSCFSHW